MFNIGLRKIFLPRQNPGRIIGRVFKTRPTNEKKSQKLLWKKIQTEGETETDNK